MKKVQQYKIERDEAKQVILNLKFSHMNKDTFGSHESLGCVSIKSENDKNIPIWNSYITGGKSINSNDVISKKNFSTVGKKQSLQNKNVIYDRKHLTLPKTGKMDVIEEVQIHRRTSISSSVGIGKC